MGDTLKFGRVRFKVIMLHNDVDGVQVYKPRSGGKSGNAKVHHTSRESYDDTESDNDMPDIDAEDENPPRRNGVNRLNMTEENRRG